MKKILITGATGFIGNDISKRFLEEFKNCKITIIGRKIKLWNNNIVKKNIKYFDLSKDNLKKLGNYDYIIHCAALLENKKFENSWDKYYQSNVTLVYQILKNINFKKFIFLSSGSIFSSNNSFPNPNNYYGLSKYISEKMLEIFSIKKKNKIIVVRLPVVIGMNSICNIVDKFAKDFVNNKTVKIYGHGKLKRNIIHIEEVVELITKLTFMKDNKYNFEVFDFGSSSSMNIIDIAFLIKKITNSKSNIVNIKNVRRANYNVNININKIKNIMNYKPISTRKSIIKLIEQKYL